MYKDQIKILKSIISESNVQAQKDVEEFIEAMDIETINFDGDVFLIATGGTEEQFEKIYKDQKQPITLIAMDSNNSLPASLEIATFLRNNQIEFNLYHGNPEEVRENLITSYQNPIVYNHEMHTKPVLEGQRLGVIGKPSDWLIASKVDYQNVKDTLGVELIDVPFEEFQKAIKLAHGTLLEYKKYKHLTNDKIRRNDILKALRIYRALKAIIKRYKLDGITVRCFDLLGTVHSTSCLALAILNSEKITSACEGDIPALLSMHIFNKLFKKSSFQCNPSYINSSDNTIYLAHCTLPLDMCKTYCLDTHFESGIGVGIHGELIKGQVTILKVSNDLTKFSAYSGKIVQNLYKNNLCRTQIKVLLNEPVDNLLTSPLGNHLVVAYGNLRSDVVNLLTSEEVFEWNI